MILALVVGFVYFGFGSNLFLGFIFVFFFLCCIVVAKVERWLWPVVVVVGVVDGRDVCGFFCG